MGYDARRVKIITEFINSGGRVTAQYLSKKIGVSSRTIRSDIKLLSEELVDYNLYVKSRPKIGYVIENFDLTKCKMLKEYVVQKKENIALLPDERVYYIIKKLLKNSHKFITLEGMANKLFVSKSTIDKDTEKVEAVLNGYGLKLLKKPNYGMRIIGNEFQLRCMISNYLKDIKMNEDVFFQNSNYQQILKVDVDSIKKIILDVYEDESIKFSDIAFNNLVMHIAVAIQRIEEDKEIEIPKEELNRLKDMKEFKIANKIVKELELEFNVNIPESENAYITIHLLGIKAIKDEEFSLDMLRENISSELLTLIQNMIKIINDVYKIDFSKDEELVYGLALHLRPTINRLKNKMNIRNPLLDEIKEEYTYAFDMAITASEALTRYSNFNIDENEIGYLAMHIGAALERKTGNGTIKKIAIVCATGMGTAQLLASKIRRMVRDVVILGVYPSYKSQEVLTKKPDLVVATVPVDINEIPVIRVSALFGKDDVYNINNVLNNLEHFNDNCRLYELFNEKLFVKGIKTTDKYEIIKKLSEKLYKSGYVSDTFFRSAVDRENISSTSTGNLLAIPHAFDGNVISSGIAVGILDKPITWGENMVQVVFLLALEKLSGKEYEAIFNSLYTMISDKKRVLSIIDSNSYTEFIQKFKFDSN